ncbi:MAG: site-specific integrase [Eubacterium sp.]
MNYDKVKRNGKEYFRYRYWDSVLKKHDKPIYGITLKELKVKYEVYMEKKRAGVQSTGMTFSEYCKYWLYDVHLMGKKPSTAQRYDSIYRNYIENSYAGKIKLDELNSDHLQRWYNDLFNEKEQIKRGKGESTIDGLHKIVSPCMRHAFKTGRILRNHAELIIMPKNYSLDPSVSLQKQKVNPLTLDEQKTFIKAICGHPLEALLNTALDTGMRQGELFALTWSDVDFEEMNIRINKTYSYAKDLQLKKRIGIVTAPKTKNSIRNIPLPKRTKAVLAHHRLQQREMLFRIGMKQDENSLVFCTVTGSYFDSTNILRRLKTIYKSVGIVDKTFHDLRHTYATRLFELDEPPRTVQELLGHSDVNITLGTYTHVLESLKRKTAAKIDQLYDEPQKKQPPENTPNVPVGQYLDNCLRLIK